MNDVVMLRNVLYVPEDLLTTFVAADRGQPYVPPPPVPILRPERPIQEQTLDDMCDFFWYRAGLTYLFLADRKDDEPIRHFGPDLVSALDLAAAIYQNDIYEGPHPDRRGQDRSPEVADRWSETVAEVEARVAELKRREGAEFILLWHVEGEGRPHLSCSEDFEWEDIQSRVCQLFQTQIPVLLNC